MRYKFKQAVAFNGLKEGIKASFGLGEHEVSKEVEAHHSFEFFKKAGYVVDADSQVAPEPVKPHGERLAEIIEKRAEEKAEPKKSVFSKSKKG